MTSGRAIGMALRGYMELAVRGEMESTTGGAYSATAGGAKCSATAGGANGAKARGANGATAGGANGATVRGADMGMQWICSGHTVGMQWACSGQVDCWNSATVELTAWYLGEPIAAQRSIDSTSSSRTRSTRNSRSSVCLLGSRCLVFDHPPSGHTQV